MNQDQFNMFIFAFKNIEEEKFPVVVYGMRYVDVDHLRKVPW